MITMGDEFRPSADWREKAIQGNWRCASRARASSRPSPSAVTLAGRQRASEKASGSNNLPSSTEFHANTDTDTDTHDHTRSRTHTHRRTKPISTACHSSGAVGTTSGEPKRAEASEWRRSLLMILISATCLGRSPNSPPPTEPAQRNNCCFRPRAFCASLSRRRPLAPPPLSLAHLLHH